MALLWDALAIKAVTSTEAATSGLEPLAPRLTDSPSSLTSPLRAVSPG